MRFISALRWGGGIVLGLALAGVTSVTASAGIVNGTYQLHDHPDGNRNPPAYGLRLDGLDGNNAHDFTFSFDHQPNNGAFVTKMLMDVSVAGAGGSASDTIHIHGIVYGGWDTGSQWDATIQGFWEVDFTYSHVERVGDSLLVDNSFGGTNTGTITPLQDIGSVFDEGVSIALEDFAGSNDYTFKLGFNHRGYNGISGWGWMNHSDQNHVYSTDWLFTAELIPLPPAAWMGLAALPVVLGFRRRIFRL